MKKPLFSLSLRRIFLRAIMKALPCLFAASVLTGCHKDETLQQKTWLRNGVATSMHRNNLMDAAFGEENEQVLPQEVYWQVELPVPRLSASQRHFMQNASSIRTPLKSDSLSAPLENQAMAVRSQEVIRLNEKQLALLVESIAQEDLHTGSTAQPSSNAESDNTALENKTQEPESRASIPAHIGVIFFDAETPGITQTTPHKANTATEKWRATRIVPHVDYMMTGPSSPDVQVYKLNADRYLITYTQTTCRTGACNRWLKGYLLQPGTMTGIFATRLAASNIRQYNDCATRLNDMHSSNVPSDIPVTIVNLEDSQSIDNYVPPENTSAHACYAVNGEVHPISRNADTADVQIRFTGLISEASGKKRYIAQTQLFRLEGEKLKQIKGGKNPVPNQDARP